MNFRTVLQNKMEILLSVMNQFAFFVFLKNGRLFWELWPQLSYGEPWNLQDFSFSLFSFLGFFIIENYSLNYNYFLRLNSWMSSGVKLLWWEWLVFVFNFFNPFFFFPFCHLFPWILSFLPNQDFKNFCLDVSVFPFHVWVPA